MGRIPDQELERLKQEVSIERLVEAAGVELKRHGAALRGRLQRLGVLRNTGHEHLDGSLVIPILDESGHIVQAYGRKVRDNLRRGTPLHLYLPGPHQGVWNLDGLKETEEVILCESLIDALSFWCAGYQNVTTAYGVNGFTPAHLAAFKANDIQRVLIAYDRDEAGEKAARELAAKLIREGLACYRIEFPKGMDANGYALQVQPAAKSLGLVIRSAAWMGEGAAPAKPTSETVMYSPSSESTETPPVPEVEERPETSAPSPALAAEPQPDPDPLPAQRVPPEPQAIPAEVSEEEVVLVFGDRRYRGGAAACLDPPPRHGCQRKGAPAAARLPSAL
jgi:hypothetical protein